VGNENSGMIDAFNMNSGDFLGTLKDVNGNPLVNAGTWGLQVGNGALGGDSDKLYFAAGILGEQHGLFGSIQSVPEFSTAVPLLSMIVVGAGLRRRRRRQA
jgi:hypothetical protein